MAPALVALLVALDPGHSPQRPGALSARGRGEAEFNLAMVERVGRELATAPRVKVRRTRRDWADATLRQRAQSAAGASLLLSVHHDSPHPDDFDLWWDGDVARLHSAAGRGFSLHVRGDRPDSVRVARAIGRALVDAGFVPSRYHVDYLPVIDESLGIYDRRRLGLLNWARVPAVILECGFISHLDEEAELGQGDRQLKMARAIAVGVLEGLGRKP